ncbi:MAG TPA: MoxR family ATPase [Longimicrobium sp.]|jgi:MoxR-like ATPase|uniref:AAA family ATPase n=1 Tax=Longimicrobium sp. TaxID=2029185 RepID=UPI002ED7ED4E
MVETNEVAAAKAHRVLDELGTVVLGQEDMLRQMMVALLAGGHALLEGVPGTAKTLSIRSLAMALELRFGRVQFTPDLMPTDLIGVNVLDELKRDFSFHPGPIFTDLLLADEINRAPAKTQAALLEAMQERQVTVDGNTRPLPAGFTVFASQNPVEYEGTYPLPEAQLDRFLLKITIGYPGLEAERAILDRYVGGFSADRAESFGIRPVLAAGELIALRRAVATVHVEPTILDYITRIVRSTREEPSLGLGASPRAGVSLFLASRAEAFLAGRDFVVPDDVKALALPVLRHRVVLTPEAEVEGQSVDGRLAGLLSTLPAPR